MKFRIKNNQSLITAKLYLARDGGWTTNEQLAATFDSADDCYKFGEFAGVNGAVEVVR
jgi:hypothetical protein